MAQLSSSEVLAKFIRRARRIEAHSIAADRAWLGRLARGEMHIVVGDDASSVQMTRILPAEEAFESLAARLRPLLLPGESIFHEKVCDAIVDQMEAAAGERELAAATRAEIARMRQDWAGAALSRSAEPGYMLQVTTVEDGKRETTPLLSAALLADGWLYLDLVHVDPRGDKADADLMPLRERYAAAVYSLARLATTTLATLDVLRAARDVWLDVPETAWTVDSVVGETTVVQTGTVYYADIEDNAGDSATGTSNAGANARVAVPDILTDGVGLGPEWKVMDAEHVRTLTNQAADTSDEARGDLAARVEITSPSGDSIVVNATSTDLSSSADDVRWTLVPEEVLALDIQMRRDPQSFRPDAVENAGDFDKDVTANGSNNSATSQHADPAWTLAQIGLRHLGTSNAQLLQSSRLQSAIETPGATVVIAHPEHGLMLSFATPLEAETPTEVHHKIAAYDDLVRIAELSEADFELLEGSWTLAEQNHLHRIRQIWEGQIVQYIARLNGVRTATPTPPPAIMLPPRTFEFANLQVPVPTLLHRHPDMTYELRPTTIASNPDDPTDAPTTEANAAPVARVVWDISVPNGEQFSTWAPELRPLPNDGELYAATADTGPAQETPSRQHD